MYHMHVTFLAKQTLHTFSNIDTGTLYACEESSRVAYTASRSVILVSPISSYSAPIISL